MKTMLSKFKSKCAGCSGTINKGTEIRYDPKERKAYHAGCQPKEESNPDAWISEHLEDAYCKFH